MSMRSRSAVASSIGSIFNENFRLATGEVYLYLISARIGLNLCRRYADRHKVVRMWDGVGVGLTVRRDRSQKFAPLAFSNPLFRRFLFVSHIVGARAREPPPGRTFLSSLASIRRRPRRRMVITLRGFDIYTYLIPCIVVVVLLRSFLSPSLLLFSSLASFHGRHYFSPIIAAGLVVLNLAGVASY